MQKIDFKKKEKQFYKPKTVGLVNIPTMRFIQIDGRGNPNYPDGEYKHAIEALYALS